MPPDMPSGTPSWSVYIVRCRDGTLYTGIARDIPRRLAEHTGPGGRGARYLRSRGPLELVFEAPVGDRSLALRVERRIKKLRRSDKEALIGREGSFQRVLAAARGGD